jgi:phage terminase large subunit-like protein
VTLNEPMDRLEALILDRKLRHDANPVLSWNVANAVVKRNPTGLMHLDKSGDRQRIDGLAALVNALAAATAEDDEPSVYSTRGILTL